jgi:hypothetical protein
MGVLLAAAPAAAQDTYRQTVVVTAATSPVELGSITRTMTIITRQQIEALPAHTIADVLRLVPSVDVRARGITGVQTDFALRGANFGQMLVLVDGVRLNDAQSGHHNGDIPVPLDAVERIEILQGPGSAIFGADAFGGTVNVITRRTAPASAQVRGGADDYAGGSGQWAFERGGVSQLLSASADRSSGFMYDRDFKNAIVRSRTSVGRSTVSLSYLWKGFGANNFYGGNAPSREWTNQTLVAAEHDLGSGAGWTWRLGESYRTHGDHFIFNQTNPALSNNQHRSHAVLATVVGSQPAWAAAPPSAWGWRLDPLVQPRRPFDSAAEQLWRRRGQLPGCEIGATLRVDRYNGFGTSWARQRRLVAGRVCGCGLRWAARSGPDVHRTLLGPGQSRAPTSGPGRAWAGGRGRRVHRRDWATRHSVRPCRQRRDRLVAPSPAPAADLQRARPRYGDRAVSGRAIAGGGFVRAKLHQARPRCLHGGPTVSASSTTRRTPSPRPRRFRCPPGCGGPALSTPNAGDRIRSRPAAASPTAITRCSISGSRGAWGHYEVA